MSPQPVLCAANLAILASLAVATPLSAQEGTPPQDSPPDSRPSGGEIHDLDQAPYRTPRAGEGFRAVVFGEEIEEGPRDRRSVAAWDVGLATTPRVEGLPVLPFGSLYFWEHPDDDYLFRATVVGVYNDLLIAKSPTGWGGGEIIGTFENFTVPFATTELIDGENIEDVSLYWGTVRPGFGFGYRDQVGPAQDNMFEANLVAEPGLLYFARGDETAADFEIPSTTFEMRARARVRLDLMERNLLELPHSGFAAGADLVYGYRANWDDWGSSSSGRADAGSTRDYLQFTGYAVGASGVPFVASDRHRLIASIHGGVGDDIDRFSAQRVGGGPDPRGEEYGTIWRPVVPGAAIGEFFPEHYVIGYVGYRFEPVFFAYLDAGATVAWLDRYRLRPDGTLTGQDDVLRAVGTRLTSGFLGRTRIQALYAYNFDVIRGGGSGGYEVTVHVSGSF